MIIHGDSLEVLKTLEADSVDAVITDPPYGLSFMGKKWDYDVPKSELWRMVIRVLKPGGHLLSFGGTRTYHRMVVEIEDAGFEVRDQIQWIYGSGFPKSLDVSKAIDKAADAEREVIGKREYKLRKSDNSIGENSYGVLGGFGPGEYIDAVVTAPATPDAIKWQGFGTALKPANEPIVLARKPLSEKTVAKNVLKWGTGALNIDGSRIEASDQAALEKNWDRVQSKSAEEGRNAMSGGLMAIDLSDRKPTGGRWPANVLFDEEAAAMLDEQSGHLVGAGNTKASPVGKGTFGMGERLQLGKKLDNGGGASRFFYVAKASKRERNAGLEGMPLVMGGAISGKETRPDRPPNHTLRQNHHPTVKPIKLMEYLCKLITPPGGVILDPFMGSGSTGVAAAKLGFKFIGIEREKEYCEIAEKRIAHASD